MQVSVDFRCTDVSTTIDASLTMVMGDDMVKVVAWYDNEWGYRYFSFSYKSFDLLEWTNEPSSSFICRLMRLTYCIQAP